MVFICTKQIKDNDKIVVEQKAQAFHKFRKENDFIFSTDPRLEKSDYPEIDPGSLSCQKGFDVEKLREAQTGTPRIVLQHLFGKEGLLWNLSYIFCRWLQDEGGRSHYYDLQEQATITHPIDWVYIGVQSFFLYDILLSHSKGKLDNIKNITQYFYDKNIFLAFYGKMQPTKTKGISELRLTTETNVRSTGYFVSLFNKIWQEPFTVDYANEDVAKAMEEIAGIEEYLRGRINLQNHYGTNTEITQLVETGGRIEVEITPEGLTRYHLVWFIKDEEHCNNHNWLENHDQAVKLYKQLMLGPDYKG